MASQTRQQKVAVHILPNISRRKGKQTEEVRQLTGYSMRNIFLEKSYTKWGGEASSRLFNKK